VGAWEPALATVTRPCGLKKPPQRTGAASVSIKKVTERISSALRQPAVTSESTYMRTARAGFCGGGTAARQGSLARCERSDGGGPAIRRDHGLAGRTTAPVLRNIQAGRSAASSGLGPSPMETTPIASPPGTMTGDPDMPPWIDSAASSIQSDFPRLLTRQENHHPSKDRSHAPLSACDGPRIFDHPLPPIISRRAAEAQANEDDAQATAPS
jgi:hypothetical protein